MKTAAPTAPLQAVDIEIGGRLFGEPTQTIAERARRDPPPEVGAIFVEDIIKKSAILALPTDPTRPHILAAYSIDVNALNERRVEADGFMRLVLEVGMAKFNVDPAVRATEITMLQKLLVPLGISVAIRFTAERHAESPAQLASWLKEEFRRETDRIARRIAATLHLLADNNVVGVVDWKSLDVCKFHYFTWSSEHFVVKSTERTGHINAWNQLHTTTTKNTELIRTRHTHHIVNAGLHRVADYAGRMPERVRSLIAGAPAWLSPHLLVVEGAETLVEKITTGADSLIEVETVSSPLQWDPAIALGGFALAGWDESDLRKPAILPKSAKPGFWKSIRSMATTQIMPLRGR